jgi:hypothetical protein
MITLAAVPGDFNWLLAWREGDRSRLVVKVPLEDVSSRPDPIRRAWAALEARRGMR